MGVQGVWYDGPREEVAPWAEGGGGAGWGGWGGRGAGVAPAQAAAQLGHNAVTEAKQLHVKTGSVAGPRG